MSNRDELMAAIQGRTPSRIPYTYDAREETDQRLRAYLGLKDGETVAAHFQCNTFASLWSALGAGPSMPERRARLASRDPRVQIDNWGVKRTLQETNGALYWEISESPLANAQTVADVEAHDWPTPDEVILPDIPAGLDLRQWHQDRVVLDMSFICPFGVPWAMRGMEQMMMDMALNPEIVDAIVAKVEEFTLESMRRMFEKYGPVVDMVGCGDDYGSQTGLLMSPGMMKRFFMPSLKRHYDLAARYGAVGYHHSCGAVFNALPVMIDAGLKVLNPIQTSAAGMDPVRLKAEFGRDLCFHGAIDTQQTLHSGTPDQVRAEVRDRIAQLGPDGFILAPSHSLQPNVNPENIIALYEEVRIAGKIA